MMDKRHTSMIDGFPKRGNDIIITNISPLQDFRAISFLSNIYTRNGRRNKANT